MLSPKKLLTLERSTLEKIASLKPFEAFTGLRTEAQRRYRTIDPDRGGLDFHAILSLDVVEQRPNHKVEKPRRFDVAGLVEVSSNRADIVRSCYQLVIGRGHDHTKPVMRKLHFDYEPVAQRHASEPKPSFHLQMGGELLPQWADGKGYGLDQCHAIYPWFEKPRIPCFPVCLALLIDWILLEFSYNRHAAAVLTNADWNAHVFEAETTVLAPFIADCQAFLNKAKVRKQRLLRHHFYAQPA